jgi:hypothetical protein
LEPDQTTYPINLFRNFHADHYVEKKHWFINLSMTVRHDMDCYNNGDDVLHVPRTPSIITPSNRDFVRYCTVGYMVDIVVRCTGTLLLLPVLVVKEVVFRLFVVRYRIWWDMHFQFFQVNMEFVCSLSVRLSSFIGCRHVK